MGRGKVLKGVLITIVAAVVFLQLGLHRAATLREEKVQEYQKKIDTVLPEFLRDQDELSRSPFFSIAGRERDAGFDLNDKIRWEASPEMDSFLETRSPLKYVVEPSLLKKFTETWKEDWYLHSEEIDFDKVDLSIFHKLSQFDHWDLHRSGPIHRILRKGGSLISPLVFPVPDFTPLQALAKLRLLKGLRSKNMLAALRDVRQFAGLIYSQELLISSMVTVSLLKIEREAYKESLRRGLIVSSQWSVFDERTLMQAKRAMWAFAGFFDVRVDPGIFERVFNSNRHVGLCSGLSEAVVMASLSKNYLLGHTLSERSYVHSFNLLDLVFKNSKRVCRLVLGEYIWEDPERLFQAIFSDMKTLSLNPDWSMLQFRYGRYIPGYSGLVGLDFLMLATPDFIFSRYRQK